jgi:hypothetical protein
VYNFTKSKEGGLIQYLVFFLLFVTQKKPAYVHIDTVQEPSQYSKYNVKQYINNKKCLFLFINMTANHILVYI